VNELIAWVTEPLASGFMQRGLAAGVIVALVCGVMGAYVVLKGLAFIGDAVSHAAFPGLVIAFILGLPLYLGGSIAAVATALAIAWVSRRGGLRFDTAVGVLFAGMFAFGVVLFTGIEGYAGDLLGYLVGNVLFISAEDLIQLTVLAVIVLAIVLVLRKELLYATFDPLGAQASGLPVARLEYLLLGLLGVTIVVSIQAVGIILVVAMLVTPAATAQLLVVRFSRLMALSAIIGMAAAVVGLYLSYYLNVGIGSLDRARRDARVRDGARVRSADRGSSSGSSSAGRCATPSPRTRVRDRWSQAPTDRVP
jgi:ABC-type Mn2+/Zn2+ transport system permease subunit